VIEHGASAQVGPAIDRLPQQLLRRQVMHGSRNAHVGDAVRPPASPRPPPGNRFGQAEVQQLRRSVLGDEDVGRRDVAMNDVGQVRTDNARATSIAMPSSGSMATGPFRRRCFRLSPWSSSIAMKARPSAADVENGADVRMIQGCGGLASRSNRLTATGLEQ
jgi:hypothetical protein